jgi:hypothetical protein
MNTPPTTGRDLDRFQTALLAELTEHVTSRDPVPAPVRLEPRSGRRWSTGLVAAAATVTAFAAVWTSGPGAAPAYAVNMQENGDVVVAINRLEDSAGLKAALGDLGIDADVYFDPGLSGATADGRGFTAPETLGLQMPDGYVPLENPGCETGESATLTREGDGWLLVIPAASPMHDRPVTLATGENGQITVLWDAGAPGAWCWVHDSAS